MQLNKPAAEVLLVRPHRFALVRLFVPRVALRVALRAELFVESS